MTAYKLCRKRRDGTYGSLFINKKDILPVNQWLKSKCHPTDGYKVRPGWHCTEFPRAPHLKMMDNRVWLLVNITHYCEVPRPENQGGLWFLANYIKIIEETDIRTTGWKEK